MMKTIIGVIGASGSGKSSVPDAHALDCAYRVGQLVAERGGVLLTGGTTGVMEAASKGASDAGGITVGILQGLDKCDANPYVDIPIKTGVGLARNVFSVRASDVVIMISGGTGTLNELTVAVNERITPAIVLEGTGGWADRIRSLADEGGYLDERKAAKVHFTSTPEAAVDLAFELASQ